MKNSISRRISRHTTTSGAILLVAALALVVTGLFRYQITEATTIKSNEHISNTDSTYDGATPARITEAFGKLPLRFEANKGQSDEKVKFLSRGSGGRLDR